MESHVLRACKDWLQIQQNLGKLWFMRVNSGTVYPTNRDGSTRHLALAPEGTGDLLVIWGEVAQVIDPTIEGDSEEIQPHILWVETKHKGKQSQAQKDFEAQVREQGCDYLIVTDVDQLINRLTPIVGPRRGE